MNDYDINELFKKGASIESLAEMFINNLKKLGIKTSRKDAYRLVELAIYNQNLKEKKKRRR